VRLPPFLARLLRRPDDPVDPVDPANAAALAPAPPPPAAPASDPDPLDGLGSPAPRFLLCVDDAGQYLVVLGSRATVGHAQSGLADLPILGDVGPRHAAFERRTSLRGGSAWRIRPLGRERVRVAGKDVGPSGVQLVDGDRILLGQNVELRFRAPDPASSSVLLDMLHGIDCEGAAHVILFGRDPGGRLRVGGADQRHVRVPNCPHELELVHDDARLFVEARLAARERAERNPGEDATRRFELDVPPAERADLAIGAAAGGRTPFGLSIVPVRPAVARAGDDA